MNDDYLWDGSGEPDPDIEHLENLLGRYRSSQAAPRIETPVIVPVARPRRLAPFAAIAAAVLVAVGSLYVWQLSGSQNNVAKIYNPPSIPSGNGDAKTPVERPGTRPSSEDKPVTPAPKSPRRIARPDVTPRDQLATSPDQAPAVRPLTDVATALHLEQAEYLLRSFRNAQPGDEGSLAEIALDARQSRDLLNQNVILRRNAELRGNLPAESILGDLEPFLVDIANLDDRPSTDDVASIQQRIQKREIVADLQLYSSNRTNTDY